MSYNNQFIEATRFTRELGFQVVDLSPLAGELVSPENGQRVMAHVKNGGIPDVSASAMQCLKWTHALQPYVEAGLGCSVMLTIGQITTSKRPIYDATQEDFARWAKSGINIDDFANRSGFNFHAWYTLPTMEILDLTLWSTLAVVWEKPQLRGQIIGGWPDLIAPDPTFKPIVVGNLYAEHVHGISQVPLLAKDRSFKSLSQLPIVIVKT